MIWTVMFSRLWEEAEQSEERKTLWLPLEIKIIWVVGHKSSTRIKIVPGKMISG